ncbi:MAG TPA: hypothetical protein PKD86_10515 [Gemmatales bacterium]|nr:hypothetical protein [Gemmatales bacterium]HMP59777.1 hypothetical protein [Gemmatales bacterium]
MNQATRILLVVLRLAIGWHLFVEGMTKVESVSEGPSETNRPWSSRAYLSNATGPWGLTFRQLAGDPELRAAEWLRLPLPASPTARPGMPARVEDAWDVYGRRFVADHAGTEATRRWLRGIFADAKRQQPHLTRPTTLQAGGESVTAPLTFAERVGRYQERRRELAELSHSASLLGKEVNRPRQNVLRAEIQQMQRQLLRELDEEALGLSNTMKRAWLAARGFDISFRLQPLSTALAGPAAGAAQLFAHLPWSQVVVVAPEPKQSFTLGAATEPPPSPQLEQIDFLVRWGLTVFGLGLLLGLFTRTCSVGGAVLLLLFYVAMPPWPGLPANPMAEGTYIYVNKTLIEALALMVLATTASGRWLGIDALLSIWFHRVGQRLRQKWEALVAAEAAATQS